MLDQEDFLNVVRLTPLVAIDLVVSAGDGSILMGKRINEPAAGYWFVPGGRIFKGETLDQAFQRISATELGIAVGIAQGRLMGAFTHHYETNFARVPGIETHYVVLAYQLPVIADFNNLPVQQHLDYRWVKPDGDLKAVHPNSQAYFSFLR